MVCTHYLALRRARSSETCLLDKRVLERHGQSTIYTSPLRKEWQRIDESDQRRQSILYHGPVLSLDGSVLAHAIHLSQYPLCPSPRKANDGGFAGAHPR